MSFLQKLIDLFCEVVFPTHCVACRSAGEWWCVSCRESADRLRADLCPACGSVTRKHECKESLASLDAVVASGFYHDPKLRVTITSLKYRGATCVLPDIQMFLSAWAQERLDPWPWAGSSSVAIQHIPATPSRVRLRGFDQASLVADLIQRILVPWGSRVDLLERKEGNVTQASLDHGDLRWANVSGSFDIRDTVHEPMPNIVLLVDDVFTTGSTMDEAARILKHRGVEKVYGCVLAVGK